MQLTNPSALWWLLAIVPLVALFLLKSRPRQQSVSTLWLWEQIVPEGPAWRWLHRWRDRAMLLLNLLLLALLVFSLSAPRFPGASEPVTDWVVLVDNSASLQAGSEGATRWQQLQVQLDRFLSTVPSASRVAILAAATPSPLQQGWLAVSRELKQSAARLKPSDAPGKLADTLQLALDLAATREKGRVLVFTDGQGRMSIDDSQAQKVEWITVGEGSSNTAITQFQVRRSFADPQTFEVWIEVSHFADTPLTTTLEIFHRGELLDVVPIELAPQQVWRQSREHVSAEGGELVVRLTHKDALTLDNRAVAILDPRPSQRVDLVTPGSLYLEQVLRAIPWVDLHVHPQMPTDVSVNTLWVIHRSLATEPPAGNSIFVDVRESNSHWKVGPLQEDLVVAQRDESNEWLAHVDLADSRISGAHELTFVSPVRILLRSVEDVPIYSLLTHERGRTLVLNVDLEQGDLPWRTAFPLLVAEALRGLDPAQSLFRRSLATGDVLRLREEELLSLTVDSQDVTDSMRALELQSPTGVRSPVAKSNGKWVAGPLTEVGDWKIVNGSRNDLPSNRGNAPREGTANEVRFACNLVNVDESDLRKAADAGVVSVGNGLGDRMPWRWLALAALGISALEWFLYQRRWIGS